MSRLSAAAASFALTVALDGCLLSSTELFSVSLGDLDLRNLRPPLTKSRVNLDENGVYREHRDDIKRVDRIGFATTAVNRGIVDAEVSLWFSRNPNLDTLEALDAEATLLVRNFPVPAGPNNREEIDFDRSAELLENFDTFQEAVVEGSFTIYLTGFGTSGVVFEDFVLIVAFTVGV